VKKTTNSVKKNMVADGIFAQQVGRIEVFMLVESQALGDAGILLNADHEILARCIPKEGFTKTTNAFLIKTPEKNIMIDTGIGAGDTILDRLRTLGLEPDMIDAVLLTHLHRDHFGGLRLGGLQGDGGAVFPNASIFVPARDFEYFTQINLNQAAADILALYEGRLDTFEPGGLGGAIVPLFSGISPVANFGHTPGHTVFLIEDEIEDEGERLFIAGDFLHIALVQFPNPDISATYDVNPAAAAASRRQILGYAATNNIPIGGMHIIQPGVGRVEAEGNGFRFVPM